MANILTKIIYTATMFAPTFLSVSLICLVAHGQMYVENWIDFFATCIWPKSDVWWIITIGVMFFVLALIALSIMLNKVTNNNKTTIEVKSHMLMENEGQNQIASIILPWMSLIIDDVNVLWLFFSVAILNVLLIIVSYNTNSYNLMCSILGYRYYWVETDSNKFLLLSKKCVKQNTEIKEYAEISDSIGVIKY